MTTERTIIRPRAVTEEVLVMCRCEEYMAEEILRQKERARA